MGEVVITAETVEAFGDLKESMVDGQCRSCGDGNDRGVSSIVLQIYLVALVLTGNHYHDLKRYRDFAVKILYSENR